MFDFVASLDKISLFKRFSKTGIKQKKNFTKEDHFVFDP